MIKMMIDLTFFGLLAISVVSIIFNIKDKLKKTQQLNAKEEMQKLQGFLKDLIDDASKASASLNEQLMLRKSELEALLVKIEDAEKTLIEKEEELAHKKEVEFAEIAERRNAFKQEEAEIKKQIVGARVTLENLENNIEDNLEQAAHPLSEAIELEAKNVIKPTKRTSRFSGVLSRNFFKRDNEDIEQVELSSEPNWLKTRDTEGLYEQTVQSKSGETDYLSSEIQSGLFNPIKKKPLLPLSTEQQAQKRQAAYETAFPLPDRIEVIQEDFKATRSFDGNLEFVRFLDPISLKIARRLFGQGYDEEIISRKLDISVAQAKTLGRYLANEVYNA